MWREIVEDEDLPPHGEEVLMGWWCTWHGGWKCEVGAITFGGYGPSRQGKSMHAQATHWQPLPAAPKPNT